MARFLVFGTTVFTRKKSVAKKSVFVVRARIILVKSKQGLRAYRADRKTKRSFV